MVFSKRNFIGRLCILYWNINAVLSAIPFLSSAQPYLI